jgi:bifunctional polynucleotide phosphatase/kinase
MGKTKLKKADCVPPLHKWIVGQGCFTIDGDVEPPIAAPAAEMLKKTKHKKGECLPPGLEWIVGKGCFQRRKMPATPPRRLSPLRRQSPPKALGRKTSKKKADCIEPFKWIVGKGCFAPLEPQPIKPRTPENNPTPPRIPTPKPVKIPTPPRAPKGKANIVLGNPADFSEGKWAIFDFDGTLVRPKGAHVFPTDKNDWAWWSDSVPLVLKRMHNEGYNLAIRTDQSKDWKIDMIKDVVRTLNLPVLVLIAMDKANHKPDVTLFFDTMGWLVDLDTSIYVGDAAGRQGDWSDVDRGFATNAGIGKFFTPEQVFANEKPKVPVPTSEPKPAATKEDVVIMTGIPGSGKTTWTLNNLPNFYRVSGDVLKTPPKMLAAADAALKEGKNKIVFDATNVTPEHRKVYIDWAKAHGLAVKCVFVNTPVKEAIRRNDLRGRTVPPIAIYTANKRLIPPQESEGCVVQVVADSVVEREPSPPKPVAPPEPVVVVPPPRPVQDLPPTVEDVVIMSGLPSSGKTTWAANNLHGFHRIASEQYKTQPKMVSAAEAAYKEGFIKAFPVTQTLKLKKAFGISSRICTTP